MDSSSIQSILGMGSDKMLDVDNCAFPIQYGDPRLICIYILNVKYVQKLVWSQSRSSSWHRARSSGLGAKP